LQLKEFYLFLELGLFLPDVRRDSLFSTEKLLKDECKMTKVVLVFLLSATNDLIRRGSCSHGWWEFNGRCFRYFPISISWANAQVALNLASVHSFEEYHFVRNLVNGLVQAWLGGSDAQEEGTWLWSDGTPFHYSQWCHGEPNNMAGQHCLQMNYGGNCLVCEWLFVSIVCLPEISGG
uniref:Type-2 ice-structuring protein-like n=1 Tax=Kryptolebias marmoratus TaxID=37003 RepID=A0A3Q2ZIA5_KRYMA